MATQEHVGDLRSGAKVKYEGVTYSVESNDFIKPGKGQPFNRVRLKQLVTGHVVEKTFKSGTKIEVADVVEVKMRLLYTDQEGAVFMDDATFEQATIPFSLLEGKRHWLQEDELYDVIFLEGTPVAVSPPVFLEMRIAQSDPGLRGDTGSGRVLKPALTDSGAKVKVPLFVSEGEWIKVDTRTGEYVSRVETPKSTRTPPSNS
jgi:elongation factor P